MRSREKCLIVRADFALGNRPAGDRLACKRWRRLLCDALPRLMGCSHRCPQAVVRLHKGDGEARYTAWLRIPIERRPSRKRLRKLKAKLLARLEAGLLPIDGRVLKLGARRRSPRLDGPMILPMPSLAEKQAGQLELFDPLGLRGEVLEPVGS